MQRIFEEIGYSADYMRLDTKRYYIPQVPSAMQNAYPCSAHSLSTPAAHRATGVGADECA